MCAPRDDVKTGHFSSAAAQRAARLAEIDDAFARAASGEIRLVDIPKDIRRDVRFRDAVVVDPRCSWEGIPFQGADHLPVLRVAWPLGYVDPFAGRQDDDLVDGRTYVCSVAPPEGGPPEGLDLTRDSDGGLDRETAMARSRWLGLDADPRWVALDAEIDAASNQERIDEHDRRAWEIFNAPRPIPEPAPAGWEARSDGGGLAGAALSSPAGAPVSANDDAEDATTPDGPAPASTEHDAPPRGTLTLTYLPAPPVPPPVGQQRPTVRVTPAAARHRHVARWLPGAPVDGIWRTKIAAGPDGTVYQAICGEIRRYGPDGAMMGRWGEEEGPGQLFSPTGISVDRSGTVYVADRGAGRVQRYAPDGRHLAAWHGGPPPEVRAAQPRYDWEFPDLFDVIDVAVSGDGATVLAADLGCLELHQLGPDGRTLRLLPNNDIVALALSHDGAIRYEVECKGAYLSWSSEEDGGIWVSPPDAIDQWDGGYEDVSVAPDGTIYLVSERHGKVFWLAKDGELLDAINVGEVVLGPEPHALLEPDAWFDHRFTHRAAPSGAAATRHGDTVRLHVSLHDGSIEVFERDPA